ncbi:hypothetical protein B0T22DRAFT_173300 [Podospora appendiculata]|uniref:Uncharacterized protein n=1 Tax=Podospora appendiculata TaxID=314037 RepID=A0AAE1CDH8_9PEZI|nr:hypothetical protein B0T22DRAFT_173300 [Podospora appendiculata]
MPSPTLRVILALLNLASAALSISVEQKPFIIHELWTSTYSGGRPNSTQFGRINFTVEDPNDSRYFGTNLPAYMHNCSAEWTNGVSPYGQDYLCVPAYTADWQDPSGLHYYGVFEFFMDFQKDKYPWPNLNDFRLGLSHGVAQWHPDKDYTTIGSVDFVLADYLEGHCSSSGVCRSSLKGDKKPLYVKKSFDPLTPPPH